MCLQKAQQGRSLLGTYCTPCTLALHYTIYRLLDWFGVWFGVSGRAWETTTLRCHTIEEALITISFKLRAFRLSQHSVFHLDLPSCRSADSGRMRSHRVYERATTVDHDYVLHTKRSISNISTSLDPLFQHVKFLPGLYNVIVFRLEHFSYISARKS
jgi:hypothetical protein